MKGISWQTPDIDQDDQHPVVYISWYDAKAMSKWLTSFETGEFRLPTEAEWEYACRAGSSTPYYFGDAIQPNQTNYESLSSEKQSSLQRVRNTTTPVKKFASYANPFGLCDMHGNVWEWCEDKSGEYSYSPEVNPVNLTRQADTHVMRGGSWEDDALNLRSAIRSFLPPDLPTNGSGFRLVRVTSEFHPVHHLIKRYR